MTDPTMPDILARLEAQATQLAKLLAEQTARREEHTATIAALRAEMTALKRRRARSLVPALLVALLVALMPLSILASDRFGDVPTDNPHHDDIGLIAAAGITRGCNPPENTKYCPEDVVTRQQMASFLARTAGLGGNPPVANARTAETAQTAASATNAVNAQTAQNAAQLGGQPASVYVQANSSPTFTDLTVTGTINRAYMPGTTSHATPLAFAHIKADGTMTAGTPNLTTTYNATAQRYEVTIAGEAYDFLAYPTIVTSNSFNRTAVAGNAGGKMAIYVSDTTGNPTQAGLEVLIFKP
jgi:hypothetical protein